MITESLWEAVVPRTIQRFIDFDGQHQGRYSSSSAYRKVTILQLFRSILYICI